MIKNGGSGVEYYKILGSSVFSDGTIAHCQVQCQWFYPPEFGKIGVPQTPAGTERCSDPFLLDALI